MCGYIKLHRQIQDNPLFTEKREFSKFEAWMDILISCNYKEGEFLLGYDVIKIKPGEFITSKVKLREKYGWGEQKLNNFFKLLSSSGQATIKTVGKARDKASLISVINWGRYQDDQGTNQGSNQGTTGVTNEGRPSTIKEGKESKEYNTIVKNKYREEFERFVGNWNEQKEFDKSWKTARKITDELYSSYSKIRSKYSYDDVCEGVQNYIDDIETRSKDSDYSKHRFTLYEFLKQKNGFTKFFN